MTLNEWERRFGKKKHHELHGVYSSYDLDGKIIVRDVYIYGHLMLRIEPIRAKGNLKRF